MIRVFPWILAVFILSLPCCAPGRSATDDRQDSSTPDSIDTDISSDARVWADSITRNMSLEEMAGQLIMPAVYSDSSAAAMQLLRGYVYDWHVGGIVLLKGDIHSAAAVVDTLQKMARPAMFISIDAEWGLAMRLDGAPEFPRNSFIFAGSDDVAAYDYGNEVARECRLLGINMVLGPVIDVAEGQSVMGSRAFCSDPWEVARLGVAYARGVVDGGVIAVAKHFPGHGSASGDSHEQLVVVKRSRAALDTLDLLPFREFIKASLPAVMVGHIAVPSVDPSGISASVSEKIITDLLKKDLKFDGLVITDAMTMHGAEGATAADALIAGADIVLAPLSTQQAVQSIISAVNTGRISPPELLEKVKKVLYYKYLIGLNEPGNVKRGADLESGISAFDKWELVSRLTGGNGRRS